jgi:hypothetical protein
MQQRLLRLTKSISTWTAARFLASGAPTAVEVLDDAHDHLPVSRACKGQGVQQRE